MFRILQGKNKPLDRIASQFYTKLNPLKKSGVHKKNSLKRKISLKCKNEKDPKKVGFYKALRKNNYTLLKRLITSDIFDLTTIQNNFETQIVNGHLLPFYVIVAGKPESTKFGEEILKFFTYKSSRSGFKFNWLVDELDISVCPYCQYEPTFKIKTTNEEIILHDIDHFIPKVIAPYLSMSFYNLIPSCHNCNSTLKSSIIFSANDYIHPYSDDTHSIMKFSIDNPIVGEDVNSFNIALKDISINHDELRKVANHKQVFKIQPRYNHYRFDAIRLNSLKNDYSESQKDQFLNDGLIGHIFADRSELIQYICRTLDLPPNIEAAKKMERGKFKMDLAAEFEII